MSADREVIARVYDVREEEVICQNCHYSCQYSNDRLYCRYWGQDAKANSYCSFFYTKGTAPNDD